MTDDSSEEAPGDVEDLATPRASSPLRRRCRRRRAVRTPPRVIVGARRRRAAPSPRRRRAIRRRGRRGRAAGVRDGDADAGLICDALAGTLPLDALVVVWDHVFAAGDVASPRGRRLRGRRAPRRLWPPRAGGRRAITAPRSRTVVSDLCRDADARAGARDRAAEPRGRERLSVICGTLWVPCHADAPNYVSASRR